MGLGFFLVKTFPVVSIMKNLFSFISLTLGTLSAVQWHGTSFWKVKSYVSELRLILRLEFFWKELESS